MPRLFWPCPTRFQIGNTRARVRARTHTDRATTCAHTLSQTPTCT
jgi:hypothetical protein